MLKHQIRKKILKIRDEKYSNSLNIDKKKILKIIQKANIKNGIPEPKKKTKVKPNILIIPLVAFDKKLNRLGYGGGFYDRFLCKMGKNIIIKLGLAFSHQMIKYVPVEKFDRKLDVILTEKEIFET